MISVTKNRVVVSRICIIIPIICFLFFDGSDLSHPQDNLATLDAVHSKLRTLTMLKVALGLLWDSICSTCQKAFEAGDDASYLVSMLQFLYLFSMCVYCCPESILFGRTAATGLVPISSRRTPSIKSAVRKNITVYCRQFFGKSWGYFGRCGKNLKHGITLIL